MMHLAWKAIGWGATLIIGSIVLAIIAYIAAIIGALAYVGIQAL
jgi:hypothetical protein